MPHASSHFSRRLVLAGLTLVVAAPALGQSASTPKPMTILVYEAGPAWKVGRPLAEQNLAPHFNYIAEQFQAGKVVAYGTQADSAVVRGYYVLSGNAPAAVDAFVGSDPGIASGTLRRRQEHSWQVVVDGFRAKLDRESYALLRMQPGPRWEAGKPITQQKIAPHFGYMVAQAKAGVVLAAGPAGSGQEGWYVVRGGRRIVAQLLAGDPGVHSGLLKPVVIGWNVVDMQPTR